MPCKENIALADVNRELTALWETTVAPNRIKASLFNLVVYSATSCRLSYLRDFVKNVIEAFPCRILFIEGDELSPPNTLCTSVSTETTQKGNLIIHCDKITVKASSDCLERVPYLILPHLIEDLPVFLLWGKDPSLDDELFPKLKKIADRVIFDSEAVDDLACFAKKRLSNGNGNEVDMNWARLNGWRYLFRTCFNTAGDVEQLKNARSLHITFNSRVTSCFFHNDFQAKYLRGWLEAKLGFTQQGDRHLNANGKPLNIIINAEEQKNLPPGAVLQCDIQSHEDYQYTLTTLGASGQVRVEESGPRSCQLPYTLPLFPIEEGLHFMKELFYEPTSEHYKAMLQALAS